MRFKAQSKGLGTKPISAGRFTSLGGGANDRSAFKGNRIAACTRLQATGAQGVTGRSVGSDDAGAD
jgi:hypothetical protein